LEKEITQGTLSGKRRKGRPDLRGPRGPGPHAFHQTVYILFLAIDRCPRDYDLGSNTVIYSKNIHSKKHKKAAYRNNTIYKIKV